MPVSGAVSMNLLAKVGFKNCIVDKPLIMVTGLYHPDYRYCISFQLGDSEAVNLFVFLSPGVPSKNLCRQKQPARLRFI